MPRHRCNACERWFELARVYRDGRDIEAVLEAKRKLRDEPDEVLLERPGFEGMAR
jgi:hypothetical protein